MTTVLHEGDPALSSDAGLRERKVSLYDALELIAKRAEACTLSGSSSHVNAVLNQIRGIVWLFSGEDPGMPGTLHGLLKRLNVPHAIVEEDDRAWWGDDYAKRATPPIS